MDGTITDSRSNIAASINYARTAKGLPPLDERDVAERINALTFDATKDLYGENASESDHEAFERHYATSCLRDLRLYDGILETLQTLRSRGVAMAIATNATSGFAQKMMTHLGVADYFAEMVGADLARAKPAPDMLNLVLSRMNMSAADSYFAGDSGKDMKAALEAKITSVFVTWGYGVENQLANYTINKPRELLAIVGL
jgi:phosphoglycolate phosphatase